ncbi:MAG: ThuA domain-containing protein [Rubripirellula sp.]
MIRRLLIVTLTLVSFSARANEPIRVLIVDGRNNHAWEGTSHSLKQTLLQTGCFTVDVSTAPLKYPQPHPKRPRDPSPEEQAAYEANVSAWRVEERKHEKSLEADWEAWRPSFSDYDVVLNNYNGPDWQLPVRADLIQFLQAGGGMIVLHAANNCFANWDEFNRMIGLGWRKSDQGIRVTIDDASGEWIRQPSGEGPNSSHGSKHPFLMTTRAPDHPIMRGLPQKWLHGTDELYHAMRGPAEGLEILATAWSALEQRGTDQHEPIVYTTTFGRGRVVTNTMGHYWVGGGGERQRESLHCIGFQTILARSCQWAAGREVTIDIPDAFPSPQQVSIAHPEDMHWTAAGQTQSLAPQAISAPAQRAAFKKTRNPYSLLTPVESIASMELPAGYQAQVVLSEPHIREPVLAVWDGNGALYVAEMRSYMQDEYGTGTKSLRNGRVSRHEDTNGDGILDRHTVFVDKLNLPRMLLPLDDRIAIVETDTTNVHAYRDTNGDGMADEKRLIYEGSRKIDASRSVEHQDSGLLWSIDNWIYLSRGRERFRFDGKQLQREAIEFDWNQWGLDQDDTGRLFFNANSEPLKSFQQHPVYWNQIASRAKGRWRKPTLGADYSPEFLTMHSTCTVGDRGENHAYQSFTSATGGSVFRGHSLPSEMRGDYFICDPTGHLVRRGKLTREVGKINVRNAYEKSKAEFIVSSDINFRPVSTHTGPDGCLYVVDMYRGMIQDAPWVNDKMQVMLRNTGLNFNIHHGRVYRVVHQDHDPQPVPRMLEMATADLVQQLASGNGWIRDTAQRLILLREDRDTVRKSLADLTTSDDSPLARVHALWTLDGMQACGAETLVPAFKDPDWRVREAAVRISEPLLAKDNADVWRGIEALVDESDPNVARQLILSLGWNLSERAVALIDRVIENHLTNEVVFLSAMTALFQHETPLIKRMLNGSAFRTIKDSKLRVNTQRRWSQGIANWTQETAPPRDLDDEAIALIEEGYQIYAQLCINCHGEDGRGTRLPGQPAKAPALAGSPRVLRQKEVLGRILLHGLSGPIDGKTYREVMAPSDKKDDRWIAAVVSYIRQEWGNLASVVRPADIAAVRASSKNRYRAWTMEQLASYDLPELTDRASWMVDSSGGTEAAGRAINGKNDSCDNPNQPGRWFQVDLGELHTVTSMVLTSSTPDRYPRQYELLASQDGQTWSEAIATGKGEGAINHVSMEPTVGRYFRIVQTGSDPHHRWSLSDLRVHGVAGVRTPTAEIKPEPLPSIEQLVLQQGNAQAGAAVFKTTCIQCHQVDGNGTHYGPDLSKVGSRLKKQQVLESILTPDAVIDEKYRGVMFVTSAGKIVSGFVTEETDQQVSIQTANGVKHVLKHDEIEVRRPIKSSFMPTGLERTMSKRQLLDLVEHLMSLK